MHVKIVVPVNLRHKNIHSHIHILIHFYIYLLRWYDSPVLCLDVGHITCAYSEVQHECQKGRYQQTQNQLLHADQTETCCSTSAGLHSGAYMLRSCCCQQHCYQLQRSMQEEADLRKQHLFSIWHVLRQVPEPAKHIVTREGEQWPSASHP